MDAVDKQKRLRELRAELSRLTRGWEGSGRAVTDDLRRAASRAPARRSAPPRSSPSDSSASSAPSPLVYRRDLPRVSPARVSSANCESSESRSRGRR